MLFSRTIVRTRYSHVVVVLLVRMSVVLTLLFAFFQVYLCVVSSIQFMTAHRPLAGHAGICLHIIVNLCFLRRSSLVMTRQAWQQLSLQQRVNQANEMYVTGGSFPFYYYDPQSDRWRYTSFPPSFPPSLPPSLSISIGLSLSLSFSLSLCVSSLCFSLSLSLSLSLFLSTSLCFSVSTYLSVSLSLCFSLSVVTYQVLIKSRLCVSDLMCCLFTQTSAVLSLQYIFSLSTATTLLRNLRNIFIYYLC